METAKRGEALHVLLIEDNEADVGLIWAALEELQAVDSAAGSVCLYVARDGKEARELLLSEARIGLVLLDHRLPGEDGLQWLEAIKNHSDLALRRLPVVMLSGNDTEEQIRRAYHAYASAYLIKPADPDGLRQMVGSLVAFWGQVARLPNRL
ncbi:response regulator [Deinococcus detaillensis]|uniref:Response regulator n=1 Tax=Deinococcus detaillensis TaxID=2592048 RepID=A0A553V5X3_9DEIO|nr:response regulator [Deinococcus detaillensis]TSA87865.1 response regulator [Deinococcus detaillensis]